MSEEYVENAGSAASLFIPVKPGGYGEPVPLWISGPDDPGRALVTITARGELLIGKDADPAVIAEAWWSSVPGATYLLCRWLEQQVGLPDPTIIEP